MTGIDPNSAVNIAASRAYDAASARGLSHPEAMAAALEASLAEHFRQQGPIGAVAGMLGIGGGK